MALEALARTLPPYAADIGANLRALAAETLLTPQQLWGCFVASAHAVATPEVLRTVEAAASEAGFSANANTGAKGAAAIMAQNNIYFRARIRATARFAPDCGCAWRSIRGAQRRLRPLVCRGLRHYSCADCLNAHAGALRGRGVAPETVQTALRIAAVTHALSRVLASEAPASQGAGRSGST